MEKLRTDTEKQTTFEFNMKNVEAGRKVFQEVMEELRHPMELQEQFLMTLLNDNRDTEYGRLHSFGNIHSIEDFQKNVPVSTWADFEPSIERMKNGEKNVLTAYPFRHMNMTSGTSGKSKYIPYTDKQRDTYIRYNQLYTQGLLAESAGTDWCRGRTYCPSSGSYETLPSGITVGHVGKKIAEVLGGPENADRVMRTMFTSPIEASERIPGMDDKYIHCRFFLEDRDVTGINIMYFPSLIYQFRYMIENLELLIHDIETGTIDASVRLTEECRESLAKKIRPLPERAAELREIFKNGTDFPFVPKVWPNLVYITGCSGGGFTTYDRIIRRKFTGEGLVRIYYGITATEGLVSVPYRSDCSDSVLTPGSLFMEFLPVDAENDDSQIVTMDRLEVGKTYELIITNAAGLYRYRNSDSIHVIGKLHDTPIVRFASRTNKTISLSAEKISEETLETAVGKACKETGTELFDFSAYGDMENSRYVFYLERMKESPAVSTEEMEQALDKALCELSESYTRHRDDHSFGCAAVHWLQPETNMLYRDLLVYRGTAEATIKPVHVITTDFQHNFFERMTESQKDSCGPS